MKNYYITSLIIIFTLGVFTEASAQRKVGTKKREDKTTTQQKEDDTSRSTYSSSSRDKKENAAAVPLLQRLNSDIKVGNIGISNNVFSLSIKANSGYKLTDNISAGLAVKYGIQAFNSTGISGDFRVYDVGAGVYARAKILQQFYLQFEYDINSIPLIDYNTNTVFLDQRETVASPYFGGGYMQGWGNWKFGAEVLLILNNDMRDYNSSFVEYWLGATHNF